uniref:Uncharacterized protein n=1 Tax=Lactuca sativa TaxID=4236 RepID=A0A9R1XSJ8_LACSA|nr:hypothetical protein LSAT_V11C200066100 [Lactuca sativa]
MRNLSVSKQVKNLRIGAMMRTGLISVAVVEAYKMLPNLDLLVSSRLGIIDMECELTDPDNLSNQIRTLKSINVDEVMEVNVDMKKSTNQWHVCDLHGEESYKKLISIIKC